MSVRSGNEKYPTTDFPQMLARLPKKILGKVNNSLFYKLLVKGYHQVPVREEDKAKTAIITPFGLFEYNVMPFGLRNAARLSST